MASKFQALWNHPAGPKTIHFWAPTFKWGISIANIADFTKPPEKISYPQQAAVACTGIVWSRYSMVITPKNWNLFSVNVAMAGTGLYQLSRKIRQDYFSDEKKPPQQLKDDDDRQEESSQSRLMLGFKTDPRSDAVCLFPCFFCTQDQIDVKILGK